MKKCWCGNTDLLPYSEWYSRCDACHTLVNKRDFDESIYDVQNESDDLYGSRYWKEHFLALAKVSSLAELNDMYLSERCLHWLRYLLKYILPPASIAEIGCGVGQMPYLTKQSGFTQVGVELSPDVCEYARDAFNVDIICGTIDSLKGSYDAIVMLDLIEHIVDPVAFMKSVANHSTPDTVLLMQTPCYNPDLTFDEMRKTSPNFEMLLVPTEHIYLFSRKSIQALLNQTGFSYIEFEPAIFGDDYDIFLAASMKPLAAYKLQDTLSELTKNPNGWLVRSMLKMQQTSHEQINTVKQQLSEAHVDSANIYAQLKQSVQKGTELQEQNAELQGQNAELQGQKAELQGQLQETQGQNIELQGQNAELQGQNANLRVQYVERQVENTELQKHNARLNSELSDANTQNSWLHEQLALSHTAAIHWENQHKAIMSSTSWKFTRPMRGTVRLVKRIVRFWLPYAVVRYIQIKRYGE